MGIPQVCEQIPPPLCPKSRIQRPETNGGGGLGPVFSVTGHLAGFSVFPYVLPHFSLTFSSPISYVLPQLPHFPSGNTFIFHTFCLKWRQNVWKSRRAVVFSVFHTFFICFASIYPIITENIFHTFTQQWRQLPDVRRGCEAAPEL